jgi:hypothetical protein
VLVEWSCDQRVVAGDQSKSLASALCSSLPPIVSLLSLQLAASLPRVDGLEAGLEEHEPATQTEFQHSPRVDGLEAWFRRGR